MTQLKNTPGPWVARPDSNSISSDDWCVGTNDKIDAVAVCGERDASLIAAAPDLLEALQAVVDAAGPDGGPAIGMALAAIAKATNHD
ncbi:MAG: hypothetical protein GX086_07235 [Alcaligenaceae bacterium]|nr:hypothetical protein [Alcaligenaceae bacterium]